MNILLAAINAKYIHSNLAVYSLKGAAGAYADAVELAEYTINLQTDDIFRSIFQKKPDVLFFSCYIWNMEIVLELAENIHKVLPETKIWMGGPEVSYDAGALLESHSFITGIMCGEGEFSFPALLAYYVDGTGSLAQIAGIVYRAQEQLIETARGEMMKTLDYLPFVYQKPEQFANKIIYYESSRGCPYSCSYCLSSIDKKVRFRSIDLVKKELGFFLEHKVPQVKFVDRTFNCSHKHAMEIWNYIREHDNGVTNFHFEIAADILNEEEISLLSQMRPGLVQLEIGVQTVNPQALQAIHRYAEFDKIAGHVRKIAKAHNVHQHLDLIAGLPYEDYQSFRHSFNEVYQLKPQELQLGFLKVLKGSEMHEKAAEYGIVYRSRPPYEVLQTKWITCEELMHLKEVEEMLEVHYNSLQFRNTMEQLETEFEDAFSMYEALAVYYKKEQLEGRSYSRMQRFEILRSFIIALVPEKLKQYEELLTLDFYLRENAKSRPAWAPEQDEEKSAMITFYQKEDQERVYLTDYQNMNWKQMMRMTHLERFSDGWLLFDYQHRDPLTSDCRTVKVCLS